MSSTDKWRCEPFLITWWILSKSENTFTYQKMTTHRIGPNPYDSILKDVDLDLLVVNKSKTIVEHLNMLLTNEKIISYVDKRSQLKTIIAYFYTNPSIFDIIASDLDSTQIDFLRKQGFTVVHEHDNIWKVSLGSNRPISVNKNDPTHIVSHIGVNIMERNKRTIEMAFSSPSEKKT
jgi:hypothetical protein